MIQSKSKEFKITYEKVNVLYKFLMKQPMEDVENLVNLLRTLPPMDLPKNEEKKGADPTPLKVVDEKEKD